MTKALYHRPLKFESSLVADVLSALKTLDHLVYLNNNGQPFIACCAQEYFVAQTSQIQSFKRTGIEQYQPSPSEFNLAFNALKILKIMNFMEVMLVLSATIMRLNNIFSIQIVLNLVYLLVNFLPILNQSLMAGCSIVMIPRQNRSSIIFRTYLIKIKLTRHFT